MKKSVLILAAAIVLSAAQSFAHDKDKGKKKCGSSDCCKKEVKATAKKAPAAVAKKA
ncbi:hypothetical protein ACFQ3S_11850 [Mucilaginibacter terrae]|uniref:hypothetical protein n=1 Tax=Mucilaginibacter terrae TaxID=1955052 RepID=UPI003643D05A